EHEKARMLRSVDIYCAPNLGGESFGIVLAEAMSASTPVVASDLESFRAVLADGSAGVLVTPGDPLACADGLAELLDDPMRRGRLAATARRVVSGYDWKSVAQRVRKVYDTVIAADPRAVAESE